MTTPYQLDSAAGLLRCASNVQSVEFYVTQGENKPAVLNCRIFGLDPLTKTEIQSLADVMNAAIHDHLVRVATDLKSKALNILSRGN